MATTIKQFSEANNLFATNLFAFMDPGFVYSPASLSFVLALLQQGCAGNTKEQINKLLRDKFNMEQVAFVNSIYNNDITKLSTAILILNNNIKESYVDDIGKIAQIYNANAQNLDKTLKAINKYFSENTNDLIRNAISNNDINESTNMVLINTLYFRAAWSQPFDPANTKEKMFNEKIPVSIMTNTKHYGYFEDARVQILRMTYKKDFCMDVILPKIDVNTINMYNYLDDKLNFTNKYIRVFLPKFIHKRKMNIIPILKLMGVIDIFTPSANLKLMCEGPNMITKFVHEVIVDVNEKGTEAAAATKVSAAKCIPPEPILFNANHTFVYCIRHLVTNMILFVGEFDGK